MRRALRTLRVDKTFSALLETENAERQKGGRVVESAFNRRRDAPFLRPFLLLSPAGRRRARVQQCWNPL